MPETCVFTYNQLSSFERTPFFQKNLKESLCGDDGGKDPPVPISNTAVKLPSAEDSEGFPFVKAGRCRAALFFYNRIAYDSAIAQLVERMTVNHDVAGSSPACGVFICKKISNAALAQ